MVGIGHALSFPSGGETKGSPLWAVSVVAHTDMIAKTLLTTYEVMFYVQGLSHCHILFLSKRV